LFPNKTKNVPWKETNKKQKLWQQKTKTAFFLIARGR